MMYFSARLLPCLLAALLGLSACAQIEPAADGAETTEAAAGESGTEKEPVVNSPLNAPLMYDILVGEISFQLGDVADGTSYLLEAARLAGDEALYQRAAEMAIQAQSASLALQITEAWRHDYPDSLAALRYELQVLLATGRVMETREPLLQLLRTLPEDEKEALITAMPAFYEHARNREEAARVVEDILADTTEQPRFAAAAWTTIGRMRLRAGNATGALAAARLGQASDPDAQWPAILALQLLAEGPADLAASAESVVTGYMARPDAEPDVRMGYAQLLLEAGRYDEAREQLEQLTRRHAGYAEGWLLMGILDESRRRDKPARQALERYLKLVADDKDEAGSAGGNADRARLALSRIAQRSGDDAQALAWLDAIDDAGSTFQVLAQRAELLARQGKLAQARALIRGAPESGPEDARLKVMAEARLLREHGQPEQAYRLLADALDAAPDDQDLLYDTAMAAERLGDVATLERLLRRLIALNPEAAHAYNALGYTLAERGIRLQEAQALIEKAARLAPEDGYIQDSLGWVYYKQGNLQKALDILQAAYRQQPDAEIAAHLGEVLWQMGEHDAARAAWEKGRKLDPDNAALHETMQRLGATP